MAARLDSRPGRAARRGQFAAWAVASWLLVGSLSAAGAVRAAESNREAGNGRTESRSIGTEAAHEAAFSSWQDVIKRAKAAGISTGFVALDLDSGEVLASHDRRRAFLPASNQKLLTSIAVLQRLGADYRFETGFAVRDGRLEVSAGGDPNWISGSSHDPAALFAAVAARLRQRGVNQLRAVEVRRGPFTGPIRPADWPTDQLHRHYCAPTGGVLLDQGCWLLRVSRGGGSHDADLQLLAPPPGGLQLRGRIELTSNKSAGGRYHAGARDEFLEVSGKFWNRNSPREHRGAVVDPEAVFVRALRAGLGQARIGVDVPAAPAVDVDLPAITTGLEPTLRRVLAESNNCSAEQLLRVLGAEHVADGSLAGGRRAVRAVLEDQFGELPADLRIGDGSGLSRRNRVSAAFLAKLLARAWRAPYGSLLQRSMARGGEAGTTLRKRFGDQPQLAPRVLAKTGTINGVSALSGVVRDASGDGAVVFAILMNWKRGSSATARRLQEQLVGAVAR